MLTIRANISGNEEKVVTTTASTYLSRKAFYIHGTASEKSRWKNYPLSVANLNRIAFDFETIEKDISSNEINKFCDFDFEWGNNGWFANGDNWYFNTVEDRRIASEKLIKHISGKIGNFEEIVLIGHSHGGNVAIQAADKIFERIPQIKNVYVLTIGTPAYNSIFLRSRLNNDNLTPYNGNFFFLASNVINKNLKYNLLVGTVVFRYYVNCENPENWSPKNKSRMKHIALWNKNDTIDGVALFYDKTLDPYKGMTWDFNSDSFKNSITVNYDFDLKSKENLAKYEGRMEPIEKWFNKLDYLRKCLFEFRLKGNDLPNIPDLLSYNEYITKEKQRTIGRLMDERAVPPMVQDNTRYHRKEPISNDARVSAKLRDASYSLQHLFKDENAFFDFLKKLDNGYREIRIFPTKTKSKLDIFCTRYYEINAIEAKKQEVLQTKEYWILYNMLYALENTSVQTHGFDLAQSDEIKKAIDSGRIKPFPFVQRTDTRQ